jgi:hypothetical protein
MRVVKVTVSEPYGRRDEVKKVIVIDRGGERDCVEMRIFHTTTRILSGNDGGAWQHSFKNDRLSVSTEFGRFFDDPPRIMGINFAFVRRVAQQWDTLPWMDMSETEMERYVKNESSVPVAPALNQQGETL